MNPLRSSGIVPPRSPRLVRQRPRWLPVGRAQATTECDCEIFHQRGREDGRKGSGGKPPLTCGPITACSRRRSRRGLDAMNMGVGQAFPEALQAESEAEPSRCLQDARDSKEARHARLEPQLQKRNGGRIRRVWGQPLFGLIRSGSAPRAYLFFLNVFVSSCLDDLELDAAVLRASVFRRVVLDRTSPRRRSRALRGEPARRRAGRASS